MASKNLKLMPRTGLLMDDNMRKILLSGVLVLLTGCTATQRVSENNELYGWVAGSCLAIKSPDLPTDTKLALIIPDNSQTVTEAHITGLAGESDFCPALLPDRADQNRNSGYSFYRIQTPDQIDVAVASIKYFDVSNSNVAYCTTSEGLRFSVTQNNKTVWSGYYYLGYDVTPDCSD